MSCDLRFTVLHFKWQVDVTQATPIIHGGFGLNSVQGNTLFSIPNQNHTSSTFKFLDNIWHLQILASGGSRHLHLLSGKPGNGISIFTAPFVVTVHVESATTGQVLPALTSTTRVSNAVQQIPIWERSTEELERASPEFKAKSQLRFILEFGTTGYNDSPKIKDLSTNSVPCLESLSKDFSKLLDQGSNPDVEFQCAGRSTKAHGTVVSARSEVIASMLGSDMIEGKTRVVKIPDMEPDIFEKFLRYLYSGKLEELTFEVALKLFEAGDQYAVTGLAKRCSEYLVEHLSLQNACEVLVIADAHSNEGLVEKVVDYMVEQRVPLASEVWPEFCNEHARLATKVLNRGWKVLLK